MPASVLVINSGSSSVKYALFRFEAAPALLRRGSIERHHHGSAGAQVLEAVASATGEAPLAAIGHRIVHGGPLHHRPAVVTDALVADLERLVPLAPNHLPDSLALLEQCRRLRPSLPQVVCFDTAFYSGLPPHARRLPIPKRFDDRGVRRYGFHGLAFTFLQEELERIAPDDAHGRVILAHLGNGSSLTALRQGRPIDTTMGFTPIGGVVMSTRAGDLDPGVITHLMRETGAGADELERMLSRESGLAGISQRSGDLRELLGREADDPDSHLAVTIFCYEIRKRIGAFAAALEGLDVLVFSGGIGEHAASVRDRVCAGLAFLGVALDPARNAGNAAIISADEAPVRVRVIAANEELIIAGDAYRLLH
jgi:acetate kinase